MSSRPTFLLDADTLITAKNSYYSFGLCPGFWKSLIHAHQDADIRLLDRVQIELLAGNDDLEEWIRNDVPPTFILGTDAPDVISAYADVMGWVNGRTQYREQARNGFANGADGWLAAYAVARGGIVVTHEQSRPEAKTRVPLPDVCSAFDVTCRDTFFMLDRLRVSFDWRY